ncbi:hypothetical protein ACFXBB_14330 [Streptomyces scopuliridis]|uniref:hypothetical protein n=1 Tax=Streptomyces scopuliridis TaxID=452529 RepID=UPI003689BBBB
MRTDAGAAGGTGTEAGAKTGTEAGAEAGAEVPRARTPSHGARPRAMVLDEVWRELDGVGPLSGPQGGPLSRTVKLLLDPLVIRPVLHPQCAGPLVTAEGAALLAALIHASADALRATAAWFTLLKQVRRGLRITEGNPQDLYFQLCFELAATQGPPAPATGGRTAEEALRETHGSAQGRTTRALREYLTDPAHTTALASALDTAWAARTIEPAPGIRPDEGREGGTPVEIRTVLDACPAGRSAGTRDSGSRGSGSRNSGSRDSGSRDSGGRWSGAGGGAALARLVADQAGTAAGRALWGARREPEPTPSARELGLTRHPVPVRPGLGGGSASTSALGLPFDRTVHERVFTVLQTSSDRAGLAPVPELVRHEIARSCAPWALTDESLRVAATVGVQLALGLRPLGGQPGADSGTGAHRAINSRWRREAYVLQARRLAVDLGTDASDTSGASGPGGVAVAEPLARIARELRTPWRAYLRRLWVRLHGRDVRDAPMTGVEELWNVLDGVARSVILDHRGRVRHALSARPAATEGTAS